MLENEHNNRDCFFIRPSEDAPTIPCTEWEFEKGDVEVSVKLCHLFHYQGEKKLNSEYRDSKVVSSVWKSSLF